MQRCLFDHGRAVAFLKSGRASASHHCLRPRTPPGAASTWMQRPVCRLYSFDPVTALNTTDKSAAGAAELYDAWALTYDETLREWGYEAPEKIAELLADHRSGSRIPLHVPVLDCGCGTGLSSEALFANGFESMYGVDVSDDSLSLCKKKGLHEVLELCELDTEPLPFPTDSFGAVVCVGVLSYVKEFEHIFGEWCRTTRPGGLCAFTTRTWDEDTNGIRSAAEGFVDRGKWRQRYISEPSPYMPTNPLPEESSKRIRYLVYEVLHEQR